MSITGPLPPSSSLYGAHRPQGQAGTDIDLNLQGRDAKGGRGNEADPRQGERFGRALKQAMAPSRPSKMKDPVQVMAPHIAPMLQQPALQVQNDQSASGEAQPTQGKTSTLSIAQRIEKHVRAAEAQATLKQGEPIVVKLPANVLGLSQVTMVLQGDVLKVSLAMASEVAAQAGMQAQISQLSRQLSQRHSKYSVEILAEDDQNPDQTAGEFNPLIPGGRRF